MPHFQEIVTGVSISSIIFMIPGHLKGQKVKFEIKLVEIIL